MEENTILQLILEVNRGLNSPRIKYFNIHAFILLKAYCKDFQVKFCKKEIAKSYFNPVRKRNFAFFV